MVVALLNDVDVAVDVNGVVVVVVVVVDIDAVVMKCPSALIPGSNAERHRRLVSSLYIGSINTNCDMPEGRRDKGISQGQLTIAL